MQHNFEQQKSSKLVFYRQKSFAIKRGGGPLPKVDYVRKRFDFFQEFVVDE